MISGQGGVSRLIVYSTQCRSMSPNHCPLLRRAPKRTFLTRSFPSVRTYSVEPSSTFSVYKESSTHLSSICLLLNVNAVYGELLLNTHLLYTLVRVLYVVSNTYSILPTCSHLSLLCRSRAYPPRIVERSSQSDLYQVIEASSS